MEDRSFKMLGFSKRSKIPRHFFLSGCDIVAPLDSDKNKRAFAALVHAMMQTEHVMIAKFVSRKNAAPKLAVLYPHVTKNYECLYMNYLPTIEDLRDYQFASLKESTIEQQKAAENLIDALDLTKEEEEKL